MPAPTSRWWSAGSSPRPTRRPSSMPGWRASTRRRTSRSAGSWATSWSSWRNATASQPFRNAHNPHVARSPAGSGPWRGCHTLGHHASTFVWHPLVSWRSRSSQTRQHGVVSLTQLRTLGLSKSAVSKRAATGRLHRIHRGVYAVGHPRLTASGHRMAAVLACGAHAALSHRSAGAHRGFRPDNRAVADVSLPRRTARSRPGIHVHVSATLTRDDVDVHDGIPCTSVARTLVDLADVLDRRGVERVF